MVPFVDELNAYSYLYPVELPSRSFFFQMIGPPNTGLLKSKDKNTWATKDVADSVLADKSALCIIYLVHLMVVLRKMFLYIASMSGDTIKKEIRFSRASVETILPPNKSTRSLHLCSSYDEQIKIIERDALNVKKKKAQGCMERKRQAERQLEHLQESIQSVKLLALILHQQLFLQMVTCQCAPSLATPVTVLELLRCESNISGIGGILIMIVIFIGLLDIILGYFMKRGCKYVSSTINDLA